MNFDYIAHIRKSDQKPQPLQTHLTEAAAIAKLLATKLNLEQAGELLGLMHDFGKYSQKFQNYIRRVNNIGFNFDQDDEDSFKGGDHSTAGAQWVYRKKNKAAYAFLCKESGFTNFN